MSGIPVHPRPESQVLIIDLFKAIAAQVIVWHHLVLYGPLARAARPQAEGFIDWLQRDGPAAVYAFLVIGGFLAATALLPEPTSTRGPAGPAAYLSLVWARYRRLAPPYLIALVCAIAAAAFARRGMVDPDTPAAPAIEDLLAHVFLLQSLLDVPALSAGVWYVAADLLLFSLLAAIAWAGRAVAGRAGPKRGETVVIGLVLMLALLGWASWCRNPALDDWPIYFFGAYGLGVIARWARSECSDSAGFPAGHGDAVRWRWVAVILALSAIALWPEVRPRAFVAVVVALMLAALPHRGRSEASSSVEVPRKWSLVRRGLKAASRRSYALFLIHYPVSLVAGTLFANWVVGQGASAGEGGGIGGAALVGLVLTWLACLLASDLLYRLGERVGTARRRGLVSA